MNYRVYAGNNLIYDSSLDLEELQLIQPVLEKEVSCAGSFEFTLPATHSFYTNIERFKTKIYIYRNDEEFPYWDGRVFNENSDIYNNRNVYCEGALSYFNDTHQPQREYKHMTCWQMLENLIANHNSKVDESRHFKVGIAPNVFNDAEYFYTQYESSLDAINKLAEEFECDIRVRWGKEYDETLERYITYRYLDFIGEFTDYCDQKIIFGQNLLDFTRSYDMSNLVTALLPLGKIEDDTSEGHNRNLGNEVSDDECYVVHSGKAWQLTDYELDGETVQIVVDVPGTGATAANYKAKLVVVEPGQTYYLTSRLQGGTENLFYAICREVENAPPIVHSYKQVGSSAVAEDEKELKIEIPQGCCWLYFGGNDYDYPFVLYRDKEIPDSFEDYITAEKANNSSLYVKASPREVTTYDADGNPTTVTIDPLTEWGYVEKSIEFTIPAKVADTQTAGDEIYPTLSEKREYRASKYLVTKATEYLEQYQFDNLQIEISAFDLATLGVDCEAIDIFQMIGAVSPKHGLNKQFPVNKVKFTLNDPTSNVYTLGDTSNDNLTAVNNAIDSEIFSKITDVPTTSSVLAAAQKNAAESLNMGKSGYVSIVDRDGKVLVSGAQIYISPTEDYTQTGKYWVYNSNGWGYTNDGGQNVIGAATIEYDAGGNINVAINASYIVTGTMFADRIKGKTLTLGSYGIDSEIPDGSILVQDAVGNPVFSADKDRVTMRSAHQNLQDVWDRQIVIEDGELIGYNLNTNNQLQESCRFGPAMEGEGFFGGYIRSNDALIINSAGWLHIDVDTLYVSDSGDDHAQNQTLTTTVHVDGKTLTFKHGMLILVENDEPDPE